MEHQHEEGNSDRCKANQSGATINKQNEIDTKTAFQENISRSKKKASSCKNHPSVLQ